MIYTRIDTYSVMLFSCSIKDVLELLGIPTDNFNDSFKNGYKRHDAKLGDRFSLSVSGINFETKYDEYLIVKDSENPIEIIWTKLRVHIYASGIDTINSYHSDDSNFSLEVKLCNINFWQDICSLHKVTRCDFAFDYINYSGNDFINLRKLIANADFDDNTTDSGRLLTGSKSGIKYQYRGGSERTVYFGNGDKILRLYDKKFQLCDNGNWDTEKIPNIIKEKEVTIDSWYRIEWQLRDEEAYKILYSCQGDFRYVMGEITAYYDLRKKDGKRLPPLRKIFLWTERTPIIQNANSIQPQNEIVVVSNWVGDIALSHIQYMIGILGWEGFRNYLNNSVKSRMSQRSEKRIAYINKINTKLSVMALQEGISFDSFGNIGDLIKGDDGGFYFGPFPDSKKILGPYQKE